MKSYITAKEVKTTIYTCKRCGNSWDSNRAGWEDKSKLANDAAEPDKNLIKEVESDNNLYINRGTPPDKAEIKAEAVRRLADPNHGKDECPFCGGSV